MALYSQRLTAHLQQFEQQFPTYFPCEGTRQDTVIQAMRYACEGGGKRLRPVLVMEFCRLCSSETTRALPFAAAIEMIHSYSLVHDDLPCMDNSPLRRGKPSVHVAYGEDMALLTGDALLNAAFETMLQPHDGVSAQATVTAAGILADYAGIGGMIGGQVIDLQSENRTIDIDTLRDLQEKKTVALIKAACRMGCAVGGATEAQMAAADRYGEHIGAAFQMIDDILDVTSTPEQLGKPVGSDAENHKNTYVSLLGLAAARELAASHTAKAIEALSVFGEEGNDLAALAQALLQRVQ